ncbi:hypothetical protein PHJA_001598500 [Phtheirospermum japonicum]|uniref:Uncharacterized protein n=1 Tax=Phtheirospermum japonicum TaxID=374723 RepID=A0A830CJG9_9LAMI|nr:hypothetical protein PHJA_001598500 [Phtheirospermum japonicum]
MSAEEKKPKRIVFEEVKNISTDPETLMAEINSAISALEYARAATLSRSPPPFPKQNTLLKKLIS